MKLHAAFLSILILTAGLSQSQILSDNETAFIEQPVSTGTCGYQEDGAGQGYHCSTISFKCCSQYGWCGDEIDHCGPGCQPEFGMCTDGVPLPSPPEPGKREKIGSVPYGKTIYSCTIPGYIALAFDDGPYIYTNALLDLLKSYNPPAKATFFINGQNWGPPVTSPENQALLKRMLAEGHQIGSHTWSHAHLNRLTRKAAEEEWTRLESALLGIIGKFPTYGRAPYFECNVDCLSMMSNLGYHTIQCNLDTMDWLFNTAETIHLSFEIFREIVEPSDPKIHSWLVLSHDVQALTVSTFAKYMLDTLYRKGYRSATVGECLGDPPENWYRTL